ncbi:MAG: hypothetical protein KA264_10580 [Crocinitomicaceae bacterium]|nr:hypothetical protein [Crocinitomicaceae bacterium]
MKNLVLFIVIFLQLQLVAQKKIPSQYLGVGLNSISNIKLNSTLNANSIKPLPLNFIEFGYGIEYVPKQIGGFLEANYAFNADRNSRNAIQSLRTGLKYRIKLSEKSTIDVGCYYSLSGYNFSFLNSTSATISSADLANATSGSITFYSRSSSFGGIVVLNFNDKLSMRVLTDVSINSFHWNILNNESEGFSPEKLSKIGVNLTYIIFSK